MMRHKLYALVLISGVINGCASNNETFYWGDYENTLYERYVKNENGEIEAELKSTLNNAEQQQKRVAPGIYADYGFILYKRGDKQGAINAFNTESRLYPESTALMNKLIEKIQQHSQATSKGAK
jgi:hypothetical protein